jgi:hypothetical protein
MNVASLNCKVAPAVQINYCLMWAAGIPAVAIRGFITPKIVYKNIIAGPGQKYLTSAFVLVFELLVY